MDAVGLILNLKWFGASVIYMGRVTHLLATGSLGESYILMKGALPLYKTAALMISAACPLMDVLNMTVPNLLPPQPNDSILTKSDVEGTLRNADPSDFSDLTRWLTRPPICSRFRAMELSVVPPTPAAASSDEGLGEPLKTAPPDALSDEDRLLMRSPGPLEGRREGVGGITEELRR